MKLILHYMKRYKRLLFLNIVAVFGFALVEPVSYTHLEGTACESAGG